MSELISFNLLWWHWVVLGLLLVVTEIFLLLFIALWFGIAAIIVGIVDLIFVTSFTTELTLWIIFSVLFLALWFKFFKDKTVSNSGQSDFKLNTKGIVTKAIKPHNKGRVKFDAPVLGSSEWYAISDEPINVGESIHIVEVNGQLLKVTKEK